MKYFYSVSFVIFFSVLLLWYSVNQVNAQQTYDCATLVNWSLDKSILTVWENLTMTYSVLDTWRDAISIFWNGLAHNIGWTQTLSSPDTHTYNIAWENIDIYIHLEEKVWSWAVNCRISPQVDVAGICGNSTKEWDEECDDGNTSSWDGCSSSCQWENPSCSDLIGSISPVNWSLSLTSTARLSWNWWSAYSLYRLYWDDWTSSLLNSTGAQLNHTYSAGNYTPYIHVVNTASSNPTSYYDYDSYSNCSFSPISVSDQNCWNWTREWSEQCDDGNTDNNDWCSSSCQWEVPDCSNLWLNITHTGWYIPIDILANLSVNTGFRLDAISWGDWSSGTLSSVATTGHTYTVAWNYLVEVFWTNITNTNTQLTWSCQKNFIASHSLCWDGKLEGYEQCDDGNTSNWDGCSSSCQLEYPKCDVVKLRLDPESGHYPLDVKATFSITTWFKATSFSWSDGINISEAMISSPLYHKYSSEYSGPIKISLVNTLSWSYIQTCEKNISVNKKSSWWWWSRILTKDKCPGGDYSSSYYDGLCWDKPTPDPEPESEPESEPDSIPAQPAGIGCRYSDEEYVDRGYFTDTLSHTVWWFEYIEQMRLNCLHRGRNTFEGKWLYHPKRSVTKAEVMKTMVKIMGIARQDFNVVDEDIYYPGRVVFYDVPLGHWASWYTEYAKRHMIVEWFYKKMPKWDQFSPNAIIDRYGVIKMIIQTYEIIHDPIDLPTDFRTKIPHLHTTDPYFSYITKAEYLGFVEWRNYNGSFKLEWEKPVTREEFAKMAYLAFKEYFVVDVHNLLQKDDIYQQIQKDMKNSDKAKNIKKNIEYLMKIYREKPSSFFEKEFWITKVEFMEGLYKVLYEPKKNSTLINAVYDV